VKIFTLLVPGTVPPSGHAAASAVAFREEVPGRGDRLVYATVTPDGRLIFTRATDPTGDTLEILQNTVGGLIDCVRLEHHLDAYLNDEGLLLGLSPNPVGTAMCQVLNDGYFQPLLVGPIVFVGETDGETVSLTPRQRRLIIDAWSQAILTTETDARTEPTGEGDRDGRSG
jgi:hypothetical protein